MSPTGDDGNLARLVAGRQWYHTLDLGAGIVTPGWFDTRAIVDRIPFPASLTDARCLDVGTFDGFWAFEMERRGAAEVVALDALEPASWDWPVGVPESAVETFAARHDGGAGFVIARDALKSRVERVDRSVYEIDPKDLGTFDIVYVGSLLIHLRDPVKALERIRTVCRPTGKLILVDNIDLALTLALPRRPVAGFDGLGRPWWWKPNQAALVRMVEAAGFRLSESPRRFYVPPGAAHPRARLSISTLATRSGRESLVIRWRGDPHAALCATPAGAG